MGQVLYGECVRSGEAMAVRILDLARIGCAVETDACAMDLEGELTVWIGAMGPFAATATRSDDRHHALLFAQPLDDQIVHHFAPDGA
ncbi:hypothetical protein WBP06_00645 [Novosphingobium sp. BL-8H]|uniref:hypothetical protein n=1 Tax=Novosphingobium sp. BL-8H TaxID=3127640 RepID=UPI0037577D72